MACGASTPARIPQPRQKVNLLNAADYTGFADAYYAANEWKILGNIGSAQVDYLQTDLSGYPYTQAIFEELNKAEGKESVLSKYANDFSIPVIEISAKHRNGIEKLEETLKNMFFEGGRKLLL